MPTLHDTQSLVWRLITAPDGAAAACRALPDGERRPRRALDDLVRGDDRLDAAERLDVYGTMYFARLLECLEEDFPAVQAVVGHERFHEVVRGYLGAHPSENPSVRMLGRRFGEFLDAHDVCRERPWLADLARFEWSLLEAFDAADAAPLGEDQLKTLAAGSWAAACFRLTPSLRIVEARAPVQEAWVAATQGAELAELEERPVTLLVWREDLRVFHRVAEEIEVAALRALQQGRTFAAVCETTCELSGEETAAVRVAEWLRRWVRDSLIIGVETSAT